MARKFTWPRSDRAHRHKAANVEPRLMSGLYELRHLRQLNTGPRPRAGGRLSRFHLDEDSCARRHPVQPVPKVDAPRKPPELVALQLSKEVPPEPARRTLQLVKHLVRVVLPDVEQAGPSRRSHCC